MRALDCESRNQTWRSSPSEGAGISRVALTILFTLLLQMLLANPCRADAPLPAETGIEVGGNVYSYHRADSTGALTFDYDGPGSLRLITRFRFGADFSGDTTYQLTIADGVAQSTYVLTSSPSKGAIYTDSDLYVPGIPRDIILDVPPGGRRYTVVVDAPYDGVVHVNPVFASTRTWDWKPEFSLSMVYDDNVCSYSDEEIDVFLDQVEPEKFRIETYDDLVFLPALEISFRNGKTPFRSSLTATYRANLYSRNSIKNYQTLRLEFSQRLWGVSSVMFGYSYLPSFYIRHIKDLDLPTETEQRHRGMEFERQTGWLEATYTFARVISVSGGYERSLYDYGELFNEYDGPAESYTAGMYADLWEYRAGCRYTFRTYDARGYDEPGEEKEDSDDSDASYEQDQYQITLSSPGLSVLGLDGKIRAGYRFADRYYTSKKSRDDDPYHAGRQDRIAKAWLAWELAMTKDLDFTIEAARYDRSVESSAKEDIDEEKDYEKYRVSFKVGYKL